jgi:dimethylglycine dehydrogenase
LDENHFHLTASYGYQAIHMRWFERHMADDVQVENISNRLTGFQIAGPLARDLLSACTRDATDLKFLDVRRMTVGQTACTVQRVSYTGDLGYEIYCDPMDQRQLWQTLWSAGTPMGLTPFGMRAMMSLRLDRFFGSWLSEFSPDYTAAETGMDRFIAFKKDADFIGRAAAETEKQTPPARILAVFEVAAEDADAVGYEPVFVDDTVVGFCTSGGYSHHSGRSIAMALVPRELATGHLNAEIEIMGKRRKATQITTPLFDPDGSRMRG